MYYLVYMRGDHRMRGVAIMTGFNGTEKKDLG
jgi:hypothetical protein